MNIWSAWIVDSLSLPFNLFLESGVITYQRIRSSVTSIHSKCLEYDASKHRSNNLAYVLRKTMEPFVHDPIILNLAGWVCSNKGFNNEYSFHSAKWVGSSWWETGSRYCFSGFLKSHPCVESLLNARKSWNYFHSTCFAKLNSCSP